MKVIKQENIFFEENCYVNQWFFYYLQDIYQNVRTMHIVRTYRVGEQKT